MEKQLIISVGREYGSGGHEIAQKLADHYGLPLYDHNLLDEMAEKKNLSAKELSAFDEKQKGLFFNHKVRGMSISPAENVAELQFKYLKEKAASGESFVIVGRCAEHVLQGTEGLTTIFILGDSEAKIQRICQLHNMSHHDAEVFCKEKDRRRKAYHNSHCPMHWGDSRGYELSINSSKLGIDNTVKIIENYIDTKRKK